MTLRPGVIPLCALALCWGGCASSSTPEATPEPVNTWAMYPDLGAKYPITPPLAPPSDQMGQLVVLTPLLEDPNAEIADYPEMDRVRSGYTIFDKDGRPKAHVDNHVTNISPGPTEEKLPPGRYLIQLDDPTQGPPYFWVSIEKGKLTVVQEGDLERRTAPPSKTSPASKTPPS